MIKLEHPHPGFVLRDMVLGALNLSVSETARRLRVSRPQLSRVLNGHLDISADLALRLERAGVSTARFWLILQVDHTLWLALKKPLPDVRSLRRK